MSNAIVNIKQTRETVAFKASDGTKKPVKS